MDLDVNFKLCFKSRMNTYYTNTLGQMASFIFIHLRINNKQNPLCTQCATLFTPQNNTKSLLRRPQTVNKSQRRWRGRNQQLETNNNLNISLLFHSIAVCVLSLYLRGHCAYDVHSTQQVASFKQRRRRRRTEINCNCTTVCAATRYDWFKQSEYDWFHCFLLSHFAIDLNSRQSTEHNHCLRVCTARRHTQLAIHVKSVSQSVQLSDSQLLGHYNYAINKRWTCRA